MNREAGEAAGPGRKAAAFAVHLFTSLGVVIAMFAIFAAIESRWIDMFVWLGIALIIDGIDGPLARHLKLATTLPRWSGDVLDLVVDYITYIFIPAIAVLKAGLVAEPFALPAVIAILISGAIYYSDRWMKTEDDYFRGFPAFWNMVVFYLFLLRPDPTIVLALIAVFVVLTFLPIYFIHPFRTRKWMSFNMTMALCWMALSAIALYYELDPPVGVSILLSLIAFYYLLAGLARPAARRRDRARLSAAFSDSIVRAPVARPPGTEIQAALRRVITEEEMVAAVRIHKTGGPEVLTYEDIALKDPGQGEVRIKHGAIGLNFIDTYFRTGLYPAIGGLPMIPGNEGSGVVTAVGPGVSDLKTGDRVAYGTAPGAYAAERNIPAEKLVKLPDNIDDKSAAGMMLKGLTAQYLLRRTFKVEKGQTILVHAAAGGVGLILCQWANHLGATVIGTVGSKDKAELAKKNGAHHTILYRDEDFVAKVNEITGGKKCEVVYDGVGKATFPQSLDCIKPMGMFVSFGNASGAIDAFNILLLQTKGSLFATRPTLVHYGAKREDLVTMANDLMDVVSKGVVKIPVNQTYALKDVAQAHIDLEARKTTGSTVLIP